MLNFTVPISKSLRENGSVPESYKQVVRSAIAGRTVDKGKRLIVSMTFYGKWENRDGTIRRRDHLNYQAVLIDVICAALHIDDSQVWHWKDVLKVQSESEYVVVEIDYC